MVLPTCLAEEHHTRVSDGKPYGFAGVIRKLSIFLNSRIFLDIGHKGPYTVFWRRGMGVYLLLPEGGHTAPYRREQSRGFLLWSTCFPRLAVSHSSLSTAYHFKQLFSLSLSAVRPQKVGVGFCPQNAFGCRSRQAKRSACPTQGWVKSSPHHCRFLSALRGGEVWFLPLFFTSALRLVFASGIPLVSAQRGKKRSFTALTLPTKSACAGLR